MMASNRLAKYIITIGPFDDETNNVKQARKALKNHVKLMHEKYGSEKNYGIFMLVEQTNFKKLTKKA